MPVDKKFEADGVTINKEKALAMIEQYNTPEKVAAGLEELKATWDRLLSVINVDTPDDKGKQNGKHLEPVSVHGMYHLQMPLCLR